MTRQFLRRSAHFVPGANEKMLRKSLASEADALILDLEDAVVPDLKSAARQTISDWLKEVDFTGKERIVRMNPLDTPWGLDDLEVVMRHPPDNIMVPKVSTLDDLTRIDEKLSTLEQHYGHLTGEVGLVLVSTETPLGVLNLPTFTRCPRVVSLSWGAEDLSAALGGSRNRRPDGSYLPVFEHCRTLTLLCAHAGNVQPLDTVFTDFKDPQGLEHECTESAWMGYTGKITIHPTQINIVNAVFTPSRPEVEEAQKLLNAFQDAQADGRMAFSFAGKMVDVPHLTRAQKIIDRDQLIRNTT